MTKGRAALFAGAAALAIYGGFLVRYTAFSVGGSDSSGYLNLARRAVSGRIADRPRGLERLGLSDEFAQVFIPLGFVAGPRPGTMAPFYPIGFPLHEAAAAALGGYERAPFLVSPLAAILSALLFYLLGRELELPAAWSAAGSLLFAAWPVLVGQGIQPMSDAVATFWCLAAVLLALRARRSPAAALAAGAAFGMAVLVRPTNALLLLPLAFALPISPARLALFAAGGLPLGIFLASYNLHTFGSVLQTGYGTIGLTSAIALSHFPPRFRHYGLWIVRTLTPIVPLLWLGLVADRRPAWRTRALLLSWFGVFFLFHCCYEPFDSFWFVRFLLPGAPALLLGALVVARDLSGRSRIRQAIAAAAAACVLVLEAKGLRQTGVLDVAAYESTYPQICRLAEERLPERSVVVCMAASGALEYYTPLVYARWDWVDPSQWDRLRQRVEARGARFYALLFPFEAEELPKHMPGSWKKIAETRGVGLFELVTSPGPP